MARENKHQSIKIQTSIDRITNDYLESLARFGPYGRNRAEVAAYVITEWFRSGKADEAMDRMEKAESRLSHMTRDG